MNLIIPDWPAPAHVKAFSTVRDGGFSVQSYGNLAKNNGLNLGMHVGDNLVTVLKNRALLGRNLPSEPVWLNQVHGSLVVDAARVRLKPDADASFATQADIVCIVQTADCLPVLLCNTKGTIIAAAHAGWRGLAEGVLENTVNVFHTNKTSEILAWLGPAIGPKVFEVGEDVRQVFIRKNPEMNSAFTKKLDVSGKYFANIYMLAKMTLAAIGINRVWGGDFCTVSDNERFYSYRRDGITGRMGTGIWIMP